MDGKRFFSRGFTRISTDFGNVYAQSWMRRVRDGGLVHLVRLFVEAFFGGEGVPPSHVWVGKGVLEILGGRGDMLSIRPTGVHTNAWARTPCHEKSAAEKHGLGGVYTGGGQDG